MEGLLSLGPTQSFFFFLVFVLFQWFEHIFLFEPFEQFGDNNHKIMSYPINIQLYYTEAVINVILKTHFRHNFVKPTNIFQMAIVLNILQTYNLLTALNRNSLTANCIFDNLIYCLNCSLSSVALHTKYLIVCIL